MFSCIQTDLQKGHNCYNVIDFFFKFFLKHTFLKLVSMRVKRLIQAASRSSFISLFLLLFAKCFYSCFALNRFRRIFLSKSSSEDEFSCVVLTPDDMTEFGKVSPASRANDDFPPWMASSNRRQNCSPFSRRTQRSFLFFRVQNHPKRGIRKLIFVYCDLYEDYCWTRKELIIFL